MSPDSTPTAPASLPKYLADGLPKQDIGTLHDVQAFVEDLIEHKQRPVEPDDLPEDAEVVEEPDGQRGWIVKEYIKCGTETCHCADEYPDGGHGPYRYEYWRENGELQCEYVENEL